MIEHGADDNHSAPEGEAAVRLGVLPRVRSTGSALNDICGGYSLLQSIGTLDPDLRQALERSSLFREGLQRIALGISKMRPDRHA